MALERDETDGVTLEEIELLVNDVPFMTVENVEWSEKQDKKLLYGPGAKGKAHGRVRGSKKYEVSFDCKSVNLAILEKPEDFQAGAGDKTTFTLEGVEYESILDLRNVTLKFIYPEQEGTKIKRTFAGFEFNENTGSLSLEDAEGRKLSGEAISAKGLI